MSVIVGLTPIIRSSMTVLFGHPGGNPNSHHAALAHFQAGRLEAFCLPWMPSASSLRLLKQVPLLRPLAQRLERRFFAPLADASLVQCRFAELKRLFMRSLGFGDEGLAYEANDWLMWTMRRECQRRPAVTAVHAYEDCSLWQFSEAKKRDKACIYDLPIGYYLAWEETLQELTRRYADWLPQGGLPSDRYMRPEQKRREMELADLVLVPGSFVADTVRAFHPEKKIAIAPYGVDTEFWCPSPVQPASRRLRFLYAGQLSIRKGIPDLLKAWSKAAVPDAELYLVGSWHLAAEKRRDLPHRVTHFPPCGPQLLRDHYRNADVFVFPSYFEGFSASFFLKRWHVVFRLSRPKRRPVRTFSPTAADNSSRSAMLMHWSRACAGSTTYATTCRTCAGWRAHARRHAIGSVIDAA